MINLLSPITIALVSFLIFSIASFLLLLNEVFLGAFVEVNKYGFFSALFIHLVILFLILSVYFSTYFIRVKKIKAIAISNDICFFVNFLYLFFSFSICFIYVYQYNIFADLKSIGNIQEFLLYIASLGYRVAHSNSKFSYTVLYFLPVISMVIFYNHKLFKIPATFLFVFSFLLLVLSGRREFLLLFSIYFFLFVFANKKSRVFSIKNIFLIIIFFLLTIGLVLIRTKSSGFLEYFDTQEFYPYAYGTWLVINEKIMWRFNELSLTPLVGFISDGGFGLQTRKEFFGYEGYGPTVSIIFFIVSFFPLSIFLLWLVFLITRLIYELYKSSTNMNVFSKSSISFLYSFFLVKLFILIRNGEIGFYFLDILFFVFIFGFYFLITLNHCFYKKRMFSL